LGIGRRGDEDRHRPRQQRLVQRIEVGQKSVGDGGRQIDLLAARGAGAGAISRIERVRHQDCRPAAAWADIAGRGDRGKKQALAAAVQDQNFAPGIDRPRQLEPGREPVRRRHAERLDAFCQRIAAEFGDMLCKHRPDEIRHGMLRLAQG
jgi:hypothetical protein